MREVLLGLLVGTWTGFWGFVTWGFLSLDLLDRDLPKDYRTFYGLSVALGWLITTLAWLYVTHP